MNNNKITSNNSNDRTYEYGSDHIYDGSTGMNIGIRNSPKNQSKPIETITVPTITVEDIRSFENITQKIKSEIKGSRNQNNMTQQFIANFIDTDIDISAGIASSPNFKNSSYNSRKYSPKKQKKDDQARAKLIAEQSKYIFKT